MDGSSLFRVMKDPRRERGREIVMENGVGANGVPMFRGLRNERYVWIEHKTTGEYELYDLRKDPYELRNLEDLDAYAEVRRRLAARLRKLQRCRGRRACGASRPSLRVAAKPAPATRKPKRRRARESAGCLRRDLGGRPAGHLRPPYPHLPALTVLAGWPGQR